MAHGGGGGSERWLLTYADLITLLMVFFVVMYSISEADKDKYLALKSSLQRALNGDTSSLPSVVKLESGDSLIEAHTAAKDTVSEKRDPGDNTMSPFDTVGNVPDGDKIGQLRQVMAEQAEAQGVAENVEVFVSNEGVVVSLSGNLLFDSGRAELKSEGLIFLDSVAEVVRPWPNRLRVEGHTDSVPIDSDLYPSNWELSATRAVAVARYFVEQEKLDPRRLGATAYAEFRAVADNGTRDGRQRNRRVDILVIGVTQPGGAVVIDEAVAPRSEGSSSGQVEEQGQP